MKRKLSALLAIVLAVVMVFPTAVFVGAANTKEDAPATDVIKATISGSIKTDGTPDVKKIVPKEAKIRLALTGEASAEIDLPDGYSDMKVVKTTDNGAAFYTVEGNVIKIDAADNFAKAEHSEKFEITATKTVVKETETAEGEQAPAEPDTVTYTAKYDLTVDVVPKEIIKITMYGKGDGKTSNTENDLDGYEQYNAADNLTITKLDVVYNSGAKDNETVTASASSLKLETYNEESKSWTTHRDTVVIPLLGDDTVLRYTYTDSDNIKFTGEIPLSVTTSGVDGVVANRDPLTVDLDDTLTEEMFKKCVEVEVDYTEISVPVYYRYENWNKDFQVKYFEDTQYKAEIGFDKEAYFSITVEDKTWYSTSCAYPKVKDWFDYRDQVPVNVSINWDKANKTEYYEGYVIGTNDKDWEGVVVSVTYKDESTPVVYDTVDKIKTLSLILSPVNARQKFVTVVSVLGYEIGSASNLPTRFDLLYPEVISISIDTSTLNNKTEYTEGDSLNLSGIKAIIKYNYGDPVSKSITNDDFTCSPKNGDKLTTSIDSVLVVYEDPNSGDEVSTSFDITVETKDPETKKITGLDLLPSVTGKHEYFIGEKFEKEGFYVRIGVSGDLKAEAELTSGSFSDFKIKNSCYNNADNAFEKAFEGELIATVDVSVKVGGKYVEAQDMEIKIPGVKVTKRPTLESITASTNKVEYMEGEAPQVKDFVITAKYDDKSQRIFEVAEDATGATKTSYSATINGVYYVLKLTPTSVDADTETIKVTYSEQISGSKTVSKTDEVEIEVTIPDAILTYYDTSDRAYITEAFDDLYDALEKAEDVADNYTSYYANRIPEIELRRDVVMAADFPTTESIDIDLNGHSLTMIRGEVYVASNAASDIEVTFANSAKEDGKLVYSNDEDDTVIIAQNDTYTIDRNTDSDGKYEVTISAVKNGKVTGPTEVTHGHDAQFTITPDEDYQIASIKVNNKTQTIPSDGKLIVKDVQAKLTVTVTFSEKAWENPFTDVYKSATYYKSIQFVYENGLFSGMSATKFQPDTTMTRAMFVTVLGRLAGIDADEAESRYGTKSSFSDVSATDASISYAVPYIKWATDNGLIEGYGNGKFGPKDNITHIQMYVLMQRYAAFIERLNTSATGTNIAANDVKDIPTWDGAYEAVEYAAKEKFLITSSNRLTPNGNAKRSELAMLLEKFCTNVLEWDD